MMKKNFIVLATLASSLVAQISAEASFVQTERRDFSDDLKLTSTGQATRQPVQENQEELVNPSFAQSTRPENGSDLSLVDPRKAKEMQLAANKQHEQVTANAASFAQSTRPTTSNTALVLTPANNKRNTTQAQTQVQGPSFAHSIRDNNAGQTTTANLPRVSINPVSAAAKAQEQALLAEKVKWTWMEQTLRGLLDKQGALLAELVVFIQKNIAVTKGKEIEAKAAECIADVIRTEIIQTSANNNNAAWRQGVATAVVTAATAQTFHVSNTEFFKNMTETLSSFQIRAQSALVEFLSNWPEYRASTPAELCPKFEEMYSMLTQQGPRFFFKDAVLFINNVLSKARSASK